MIEVILREAAPDDIPALHALVESAYRGEASRAGWTTEADLLDGQRTDPEELAEIIADPAQALLTAWRGEALVGCVQIADHGHGLGYFGMLSVSPTAQAGGLGRRLVAAAEAELASRFGAVRVHLTAFPQRETLRAWYERLGYRDTGRTLPFDYGNPRLGLPLCEGLHFIVMEKEIA